MPSSNHFPILLVEDNDDDLFLFRRLLAKAEITHPLQTATNGQTAIDQLAASVDSGGNASVPRVVFLDLKLPLRSGFEVLEWIRTMPALRGTAVIVLSSSAEARDVRRAYELGAHSYLVKYPPPAVIQEVVRAVAALAPDDQLHTILLPGVAKP